MLMFGPTVTLTIRHEPKRDRNGDPLPNTAAPDGTIPGCLVAGRSTSEDANLTVYTGRTVYAPAGSVVVLASDRLVIPGESGEWQVEGDPMNWGLGVEIPVRRVT